MSLVVTFTLGSLVFVSSLVARQFRKGRARVRALPAWDDPRWRESSERQVAGASCVYCKQRFVLQTDAKTCKHCDALVHTKRCAKQHRVQEHLAKRDAPYR